MSKPANNIKLMVIENVIIIKLSPGKYFVKATTTTKK